MRIFICHYMNVIRGYQGKIPEDRPSDEELFGEFYEPERRKFGIKGG